MNETMVTVVGNAASGVELQRTSTGTSTARLRLAATARRFDEGRGGWSDAHSSFYTVRAFRALAENLAESVVVGQPLVVRGRLRVVESEGEGRRRLSAEIEATAAGHDLARGISSFVRLARSGPPVAASPPVATSPPFPAEAPTAGP